MSTRRERAKSSRSQFNEQYDWQNNKRKIIQRKEKLGGYFVDVSKYVLTGVVITSLFKDVSDKTSIYLLGLFIVVSTLWTGLRLTSKTKD
jgi:hypothetical protein